MNARLVALGLLAVAGCPKLGPLPNLDAYTPKLRFQDVDVTRADFRGADAEFVFAVANPNPISVKLATFSYDIDVAGTDFLAGDQDQGIALVAKGDSELRLPAALVFQDLIALGGAMKGQDTVPFTVKGTFGFDTPLGVVKIPVEDSGTLPVLRVPKVRLAGARVAEFKPLQNKARLELDVGLSHESGAALDFGQFDYRVRIGDREVATGLVESVAGVTGTEERTLTLPLDIDLVSLGTTVVTSIANKQPLDMGLGASMSVQTPLGPIPLTIDERGRVELK